MYKYSEERPRVFTEDGQVGFLKVRDHAQRLLAVSGAVTCGKIVDGLIIDSWFGLACVDRLVELGELKPVCREGDTQDWVYVGARR